MHGATGKSPQAATKIAPPRIMLLLLVAMTGVAPISLYLLVPALPVLATTFGHYISIPFLILFFMGFAYVGTLSLHQSR